MNLETMSDKHVRELERLLGEVLIILRSEKLLNEPEADAVRLLETQTGDIRRARFDRVVQEYVGY